MKYQIIMKDNEKSELLDLISTYKSLGEKYLEGKVTLIGKAPHLGTDAWLNCIFAPLDEIRLNELEVKLGESIPFQYRSFLKDLSNGLDILSSTLSLYGLWDNYIRTVDEVWQPYSLVLLNKQERPSNAKENFFFFGSYNWDGSLF